MQEWKGRQVEAITKPHVNLLLEKVSAGKILLKDPDKRSRHIGTPNQANAVFAQLSKFFNWYAGKWASHDYRPPIHKDMRGPKLVARKRVLSDDELRVMWPLLAGMGIYGACLRTALLTGQRFGLVGRMRRADLHATWKHNGTGLRNVWDPTREDEASNKHSSLVPMSDMAWAIVQKVPIINEGKEWVFSDNGKNPFNGWSNAKERLDAAIREAGLEFEPWQHRDLRRTARTLLARAGVSTEVAEHCLGHVLPTIQRTYNRHDYAKEKQVAFAELADMVESIVHPEPTRRTSNRR